MGEPEELKEDRPLLRRVEEAAPIDAVAVVDDELAKVVGARGASFLIADYLGRAVVRFDRWAWTATNGRGVDTGVGHTEIIQLAGTVYERVLRSQQADVRELDDGVALVVPVTVSGDVLGVLEVNLPAYPEEQALADIAAVAHALGYIVVANRRYTDHFERGQRTVPFSLAAEIQRRLLPTAFTHEARRFTLSGWLEPASTVGGDTFDYAFDRDTLHLSITDAVGNDVNAALLATVLVSSLRNGRRQGMHLAEQAQFANDSLAANSPPGEFVTGQLLRVDLASGATTIINAGHLCPLRLRHGKVEELQLEIDLPFGLYPGREFRLQPLQLEPGDRLLLVTDGVLDRNSAHHDLPDILARSIALHPRELVRELGDAVINATGGYLRDDATVLCLDWRGDERG